METTAPQKQAGRSLEEATADKAGTIEDRSGLLVVRSDVGFGICGNLLSSFTSSHRYVVPSGLRLFINSRLIRALSLALKPAGREKVRPSATRMMMLWTASTMAVQWRQ